MALWKPFRGSRSSLDVVEKHDGYVYFCIDDGTLFFDYIDADGNLQRKQINAKEAEKLIGYDITTILNASDVEIPTSKAVLDALANTDRLPVVPIEKGGTGATTALGAEYKILGNMQKASTGVSDTTQIVYKVTAPSTTMGATRYRNASDLWEYIKGKSDALYATTEYVDNIVANADEIYVGDTEPTDPNIQVWVNTGEDEVETTVASQARMTTVTLPASSWTGSSNPWSQVVNIAGVTANSKVDLQPTVTQIVSLQNEDIALMTENNDGVITVYAIGGKPTVDYTMQAMISEVTVV